MEKDVIDKIFEDTKSFVEKKQQDNKNIIANIKIEITELEAKREKIEELVIDGTFDRKTYLRKRDDIEQDIISKRILLEDYESGLVNVAEIVEYGKRLLYNLSGLWLKLDTAQKRDLQDYLFPEGLSL